MTDFGKVLYDATNAFALSQYRYALAPWEELSGSRQAEYRACAETVVSALLERMMHDADSRELQVYQDTKVVDSLYDWMIDYLPESLYPFLPAADERESGGAR